MVEGNRNEPRRQDDYEMEQRETQRVTNLGRFCKSESKCGRGGNPELFAAGFRRETVNQ
jgi:hypothetical protein